MQVIFILSLFVLFSFFIFEPGVVFQAAQNGVSLWAKTVVPSMLPFFILNHVLFAAGGIRLVGDALNRPVRKILNLPGDAAFILVTGYSTGVPVSAALIAECRKEGRFSRDQANRLLAYSANVSPAFILSAAAVSILSTESAGPFLAAVHYGTNLGLMLLSSLFFRRKKEEPPADTKPNQANKQEDISVRMVIDALTKSIRTIFLIGGVIVVFFVLIAFFRTLGLFGFIGQLLSLPPRATEAISAAFCGFMEITAGTQQIAGLSAAFPLKIAVLSAVFAFGGLSALMQIVSQLRGTDLSVGFYLKYKIIQGALAFTVSLLFPIQTEGVCAVADFAHTPPLAAHAPFGRVLYGIAVISAFVLIFRRLCCAERRRSFYRYSSGSHRGFSSRCRALYRGCFRSDKEHR